MKKILVVDDEPAVCDMLKKFLALKGYEAIIALSGKEAIEKLEREKPDAVFLDIIMPGMDGEEVLKKIRESDKNIGIVMITALRDMPSAERCLELGANDYITKPFSLSYLEKVLTTKLPGMI